MNRRLAVCKKANPSKSRWDALPGRSWKCTIEDLPTNVVQRGTRMVGEVTCLLDNTDLKLLPNTNVSVAVVLARHENALTVPREAVRQDAEGKYVFQVVERPAQAAQCADLGVELDAGGDHQRHSG